MNNPALAIFKYQENQVRTQTIKGEIWIIAKDVAEILGVVWNGNATIKHVPEEWKRVTSDVTIKGEKEMLAISEQGLYFFLGRSDKPAALPFQKWIAGEVLPSIRKTGYYGTNDPLFKSKLRVKMIRTYKAEAKTLGMGEAEAIAFTNRRIFEETGENILDEIRATLARCDYKPKKQIASAAPRPFESESIEQFIEAWQGSKLPVPFGCCTTADFYEAYKTWLRDLGRKCHSTRCAIGRAIAGRWVRRVSRLSKGETARVYAPNGDFDKSETIAFRDKLRNWQKPSKAAS